MIPLLIMSAAAWAAGGIEVVTDPAGATVSVDSEPAPSVTPTTVQGLTPGRHTVEVRRGCAAGRQVVEVLEGTVTRAVIPMVEQGGMLQLQLSPPDAKVELNGAPFPVVGSVPMAVDCGKHQLRVTAPGHAQAVVSINVAAGRTTTMPITLDPVGMGRLDVDVAPPTAILWLDDQLVGAGPMQLEVEAGPHVVRATLDGYLDQERQVVAIADATVPVALGLVPAPDSGVIATSATTPPPAATTDDERKRKPWIGLAVAGLGLGALGVGTAEYLQAQPSYDAFLDRKASIEAGSWPLPFQEDPSAWAYGLYDTEVKPHRQRMIIFDALGGVLLTTGLVLTFTL